MKSKPLFILLIVAYLETCVSKSTCGRRLIRHRALITNGYVTNEGDWPWHAAIYHESNNNFLYKCGGSLISSNSVLTAAHCLFEFNRIIVPDRVLVRLGKHNLKLSGSNSQELLAYKIILHPNFDSTDLSNDIGIIRLSTEATFNKYVQPICLWDSNKIDLTEVVNKMGTVVGWGITETDTLSDTLQQATMPIVSMITCLKSNREFYGLFLSEFNFCAGYRNGTSVCNGDSGGSMVLGVNGIYHIRGIVSLSATREDKHLCNSKEYVVFTDVAKYLTWIEKEIPQKEDLPKIKEIHERTYSLQGINFQPSGNIMWNKNCDFYGGDITNVFLVGFEDCQKLCSRNDVCTHFSWTLRYENECLLKYFDETHEAIVSANNAYSCGFVAQRNDSSSEVAPNFKYYGTVVRGENCDFYGGDIGKVYHTRIEECQKLCSNNDKCTHFGWTAIYNNECLLKNFGSRHGLNTAVNTATGYFCGWPIRQTTGLAPPSS